MKYYQINAMLSLMNLGLVFVNLPGVIDGRPLAIFAFGFAAFVSGAAGGGALALYLNGRR